MELGDAWDTSPDALEAAPKGIRLNKRQLGHLVWALRDDKYHFNRQALCFDNVLHK